MNRESDDIFGYVRQNNLTKLKESLNADNINSKDEDGFTALHLAADRGHVEAVKLLIDAGADLDIKTDDEETALHLGN